MNWAPRNLHLHPEGQTAALRAEWFRAALFVYDITSSYVFLVRGCSRNTAGELSLRLLAPAGSCWLLLLHNVIATTCGWLLPTHGRLLPSH